MRDINEEKANASHARRRIERNEERRDTASIRQQRRARLTSAGEYLVDFVDKVLEAFQAGTGIRDGAPEPITHDVARRLIWREVRRTFDALTDDAPMPRRKLWLRISRAGADSAAVVFKTLDATKNWHIKHLGPRGDDAVEYVFYAVGSPFEIEEVHGVIEALENAGCEVRDFNYGAGIYVP